ncbi:MAG: DUF58 domain-containing protein [Flavobacteriales bacterium]|nr:DUF58 domain-containing protein [Flavobacteriales bacterium]
MDSTELLKKVRAIEIKTRGLSSHIFSGEYHSAFKGRGMAFSEVREYVPGDEIKNIDWNVTARMGHPYVKVFEEERELTVMVLVDVSGSGNFGTRKQTKRSLITELTATLAFSAIENNDKTGVIFFSDKVEKYIPPKKGRTHILRIVRELIDFKPSGKGTDLNAVLEFLNGVQKKRCICFLLSDFECTPFETALRVAAKRHDMVPIRIYDHAEEQLPTKGNFLFSDAESGEQMWIHINRRTRAKFKEERAKLNEKLKGVFNRCGLDYTQIATDQDYVRPLSTLFKRRVR